MMTDEDYFRVQYVGDVDTGDEPKKSSKDDFVIIKQSTFYAPIIRDHKKVSPYKGKLKRPPDQMALATYYDYQCYKLAWDRKHRLKC
jgi:hypothetical protein